jgi:hypothetical protein
MPSPLPVVHLNRTLSHYEFPAHVEEQARKNCRVWKQDQTHQEKAICWF